MRTVAFVWGYRKAFACKNKRCPLAAGECQCVEQWSFVSDVDAQNPAAIHLICIDVNTRNLGFDSGRGTSKLNRHRGSAFGADDEGRRNLFHLALEDIELDERPRFRRAFEAVRQTLCHFIASARTEIERCGFAVLGFGKIRVKLV